MEAFLHARTGCLPAALVARAQVLALGRPPQQRARRSPVRLRLPAGRELRRAAISGSSGSVDVASTSLTFASREEHRAWLETQSALPAGFRTGTTRFSFVPVETPKPAQMNITVI